MDSDTLITHVTHCPTEQSVTPAPGPRTTSEVKSSYVSRAGPGDHDGVLLIFPPHKGLFLCTEEYATFQDAKTLNTLNATRRFGPWQRRDQLGFGFCEEITVCTGNGAVGVTHFSGREDNDPELKPTAMLTSMTRWRSAVLETPLLKYAVVTLCARLHQQKARRHLRPP